MSDPETVLVTGGAGFIGSAVVRALLGDTPHRVVNLDALTYAADPASLANVAAEAAAAGAEGRYAFEHVDIRDRDAVRRVFEEHRPDAVLHLAAESHVDRSIDGPAAFIETNVLGTFTLLEEARRHRESLKGDDRAGFRFVHVSTDEVYGSLDPDRPEDRFRPGTPYDPSSPYSATKAASDHLARAWFRTYGLPTLVTGSSNNYGPRQFPEKLIPLMILNALEGRPMPVYGTGEHVRDWVHVDDHARALLRVLADGTPGETYLIGGHGERSNLEVVERIADLVDELAGPLGDDSGRRDLIRFVQDRPGHDLRYAIDASKIEAELGWRPEVSFDEGLRETVAWYLAHRSWWQRVRADRYGGERLGLGKEAG